MVPFTEIEVNGSNKTDGKILNSVSNNLFALHGITQVGILDRHLGINIQG